MFGCKLMLLFGWKGGGSRQACSSLVVVAEVGTTDSALTDESFSIYICGMVCFPLPIVHNVPRTSEPNVTNEQQRFQGLFANVGIVGANKVFQSELLQISESWVLIRVFSMSALAYTYYRVLQKKRPP